MTTGNTTLLGLALPVEGELDGSWGDVVNDSITSLLDSAIAGTTTLTVDADVTLTDTALAANQARQSIILWNPASGTVTRNITVPARSKIYTVINASGGTQSIVIRGAGPTTGVTVVKGESAVIAWRGTDFIKISNTGGGASFTNVAISGATTLSGLTASTALALDGSKNVMSVTNTGSGNNVLAISPTLVTPALGTPSSGVVTNLTGTASININGSVGATTASTGSFTTLAASGDVTLSGGTPTGVPYLNGSNILTSGGALTFDGQNINVNSVSVGNGAGPLSNNTAVGYSALASNTGGGSNTAIGFNALSLSTFPQWQTAIGTEALKKSQGSSNTAVGGFALQNTTIGNDNTVVGAFALSQNITGANNVVVGANAVANHTAGSGNVAVGSYALLAQTAGSNNTIVGFFAGSGLTSGSRNTFVGTYDGTDGSGSLITSGSANTILGGFNGNRGGVDIRTASNYVVLSDGDGNPRGVFNDIGNFSVVAGAAIADSRINPRVSTSASTATLTPDIYAFDQYNLTAQAVALTVAAPDGSPEDGNKLILRISDDGTSQAITWNGTYTVIGTTLPTATVAGKTTYVGCIYNSNQVRWDVVAVTTQA